MKTTKRLFAMLLATAMVMSLLVPTAFATAETVSQVPSSSSADISGGTESPITKIPVYKTVKTTVAGTALPAETFYVQMAPATTDEIDGATVGGTEGEDGTVTGGTAVEAGIALAEPILAFDFSASDKSATGTVIKSDSFDVSAFDEDAAFDHSGVYRYYITEVKPVYKTTEDENEETVKTDEIDYYTEVGEQDEKTQYIVYDNTKYVVDLYVAPDPNTNGKYVITNVTVRQDGETNKPTAINFINTIQCATIKIMKVVDGEEYKSDEEFSFHILIPEEGDTITLGENDTIQARIYNNDGTLYKDTFTLAVKGKTINDNVEENGTAFKLKNGQYIEITAPISMIYKVQEEVPTAEGYTVTATYKELGDYATTTKDTDIQMEQNKKTITYGEDEDAKETECMITCVRGSTNTDKNEVIFTNTRKVIIPSGINLDVLPYVLALVAAIAAGGACFFFRKRRTVR